MHGVHLNEIKYQSHNYTYLVLAEVQPPDTLFCHRHLAQWTALVNTEPGHPTGLATDVPTCF